MSPRRQATSRIEDEASEWLVTMNQRTVSLEQRHLFRSWLRADPEHARIYQAQRTAWFTVGRMRHLLDDAGSLDADIPPPPLRASRGRRRVIQLAQVAALIAVLAGGALLAQRLSWPGAERRFETRIAEVRDVRLQDGTRVTLGASSEIRVSFSRTDRRVVLTQGQAFFEVTHDTTRPFYVTAGNTRVRVVGTKFEVHYGPQAVRVAVAEGRVEVASSSTRETSAPEVVLTSGEAAVAAPTGQITTAYHMNTADLDAWRKGRLVYVDARLRDVVADLNRYYDGGIELADPEVGDLQLTAAFRVDQIGQVIEVLESALPIDVTRSGSRHFVLRKQQPPRAADPPSA